MNYNDHHKIVFAHVGVLSMCGGFCVVKIFTLQRDPIRHETEMNAPLKKTDGYLNYHEKERKVHEFMTSRSHFRPITNVENMR